MLVYFVIGFIVAMSVVSHKFDEPTQIGVKIILFIILAIGYPIVLGETLLLVMEDARKRKNEVKP